MSENSGVRNVLPVPRLDKNCAPFSFHFTAFYTSLETSDYLGHALPITLHIPKQSSRRSVRNPHSLTAHLNTRPQSSQ
jgi:hypothetical protein